MAVLNAHNPNNTVRAVPVELTNGQWALCADLLSETEDGKLYSGPFRAVQVGNCPNVEVIDWSEIEPLLIANPEP